MKTKNSKPTGPAKNESRIYGKNACLTAFKVRPFDVIKAYIQEGKEQEFAPLMKALSKEKKAYSLVSEAELAKITAAEHHEGVSLLMKDKNPPLIMATLKKQGVVLVLHDVENPHNVGAITRVAAHFGVQAIIIVNQGMKKTSAAATRVAEGGAEFVPIYYQNEMQATLKNLKDSGFTTFATVKEKGESMNEINFPEKTAFIFGNENAGLPGSLIKLMDKKVTIPGTGNVESLSVVTAATVLTAHFFTAHS